MRYLTTELFLVYPPFSNQEGAWLWEDPEVRDFVKRSKLYMIGHREEIKFVNYDEGLVQNFNISLKFQLQTASYTSPVLYLPIGDIIFQHGECELEIGDKLFRLTKKSDKNDVVFWVTPDLLLYYYWRSNLKLITETGQPFNVRPFTKFELCYVGISTEHDSFSRLFDNAHHARLKILTDAYPKAVGSRVSDELVIFLFDISPVNINVMNSYEDFEKDLSYVSDNNTVVKDAEKAFVRLLNTNYNEIQFKNFPESADGLYKENLERYVYSIAEDISFFTESATFTGSFEDGPHRDGIFIEGDFAKIVRFTEE